MRYLLILLVLGAVLRGAELEGTTEPGKLIFAVRQVDAPNDGFFVYSEDPSPSEAGIHLVAYERRGGRTISRFAPGFLEEDELYLELHEIGFRRFDYEAEQKVVRAKLSERELRGLSNHMRDVGTEQDAQKLAVEIHFEDQSMQFTDVRPRHKIAVYSLYSDGFKKLKRVMDVMAKLYAYSKSPL